MALTTIRRMARIFVEGWAPEYGAPFDPEEALAPAEGSVDPPVETADWEPARGHDDGLAQIAFVDGVRRIDARLTLDDPRTVRSGSCGSFAVGATIWDRGRPVVPVAGARVERVAVLCGRRERGAAAGGARPALRHGHHRRPGSRPAGHGRSTRRCGAPRARRGGPRASGCFVIADGPLNDLSPRHRRLRQEPPRDLPGARAQPGRRRARARASARPLFAIKDYRRYSWYVRLADSRGATRGRASCAARRSG